MCILFSFCAIKKREGKRKINFPTLNIDVDVDVMFVNVICDLRRVNYHVWYNFKRKYAEFQLPAWQKITHLFRWWSTIYTLTVELLVEICLQNVYLTIQTRLRIFCVRAYDYFLSNNIKFYSVLFVLNIGKIGRWKWLSSAKFASNVYLIVRICVRVWLCINLYFFSFFLFTLT